MGRIVHAASVVEIVVPAAGSISVFSQDATQVGQKVGQSTTPLGTVDGTQQAFGPFASGATIVIETGASSAFYSMSADPVFQEFVENKVQRIISTLNASGPITVPAMMSGIITSNGTVVVTGTLPTGSVLDASAELGIGDSFDWSVIVTGPEAFTVSSAQGHTVVGSAIISESGIFRTRKIKTATFSTYRIS